jgi:hypothetical protein
MATVNTIEKQFEGMTDEQKKANFKSLNYIKLLASTTNTNIARWDVLSLFGSGDGANLLADKKAINKIFFSKLEKIAEKNSDSVVDIELPAEITKAIEEGFKENIEARKQKIRSDIDGHLHYVTDYQSRLNRTMSAVVALRKQIAQLDTSKDPVMDIKREVQDVLKEGVWVNPVIHEGHLYLNTGANIVLTLKNKSSGQDTTLDLGQLAVKISLSDFHMRVIPYKNNIKYGNYGPSFFHPHVNSNGEICWGNAYDTALGSLQLFQLGKALRLLHAVLTQYNDESPYVHLYDLASNHSKYGRISSDLLHPDRRRDLGDERSY